MSTPAPDIEAARNRVLHCRQYMDNALEALHKNEPGKAGELLWGSFAQAVHAVDAWRGPVIDDHRSLINFAARLRQEINSDIFALGLGAARGLHHNFYVPVESKEEVEVLVPGLQQAISLTLALLPEEVRNGTEGDLTEHISE